MALVRTARLYWRQIIFILCPALLAPLVFPYNETSKESKCLFLLLLTASFWVTELLPIPVTALLPIAFRPLLGISSSKDGIKVFFSDIIMLIIGGVVVAIALETTKLHKRMAYMVLDTLGLQPRRLLLGIMLMSAFLSMWISNTAASAMMMPITKALLQRLYADEIASDGETETETRNKENNDKYEKEAAAFGNQDEKDVVDKSAKSEGPQEDAEVELLSESLPAFSGRKHQETRQRLDEILSRRHNVSRNNLATDDQQNEQRLDQVVKNSKPTRSSYQFTWSVFSLAIAYSSNIGGIGTLIGSPPNLILSQTINTWSGRAEVSFAQWSLFGFPITVIMLILAYAYLNILLFGIKPTLTCGELRSKREVELAARKVREELQQMGPVKYNEKTVLVHFITLVALLLTRRPGFVTGWSALFSDDGYVRDGSVAVAVAISLFIFSNERPTVFCFRAKGDDRPLRSVPSLLIWKDVSKKFPWGVVFLIGGGSVLVDTVKVSGLSQSITPHMLALEPWPEWLICLFVIVTTCLTTELCSNTVITILILPVMRNLATVLKVHPLYIMLPAAVSTSMAFMLPVATPPNSLIYSYGSIKISDMMKAGSVMNLIAVCVIFLGIHTWGWYSFHLDTIPEWAWPSVNISTATNISVDPSSGPLTVTDIASLSNQTALL